MGNPFTAQLLEQIEQAQLSCTGDYVDRQEMWILLDRVEHHLRTIDEHNQQMSSLLSRMGRATIRVGSTVVPPALTSSGVMLVEYRSLDE